MKTAALSLLLFCVGLLSGNSCQAQNKMACISLNELLTAMPEFKKADTTLAEYKVALQQQFEEFRVEYSQQSAFLASRDTIKYSKPALDLKRRSLAELLERLQGYDQQAGILLDQKRNALLLPIQKKAEDAIQEVSKENGYAYVLEKDNLHVFPQQDDILVLVKKRLGLR
jgi:outer membrane protein